MFTYKIKFDRGYDWEYSVTYYFNGKRLCEIYTDYSNDKEDAIDKGESGLLRILNSYNNGEQLKFYKMERTNV